MNKSFPTLVECHDHVNNLIKAGLTFQPSRVFSDRYKASKRNRFLLLLGVERKAHQICTKLAPGGHWNLEIELPGTEYEAYRTLGMITVKTQHFRAAAWYSRYLPYAYAMMKAEYGFECDGIDFNSVNAYFGTCFGYSYLCTNESSRKGDWTRFDLADMELYEQLTEASLECRSYSVPFEAVHNVAICFVAAQAPHLLAKYADKDSWMWKHACEVLESLKMPVPNYKKTA